MLASEALGLSPQIHYTTVAVVAVAEKGAFGLVPESDSLRGEPTSADRAPTFKVETATETQRSLGN